MSNQTVIGLLREGRREFKFSDIANMSGQIFQFKSDDDVNLNVFYITIGNGSFVSLANGAVSSSDIVDANAEILLSENPFARVLGY